MLNINVVGFFFLRDLQDLVFKKKRIKGSFGSFHLKILQFQF